VRLQREQNDADVGVDSMDCIKSGETTAKCIAVAHDNNDPSTPLRYSVDVTCQSSTGEGCIIEAEPVG
jgi:hypothetical protein